MVLFILIVIRRLFGGLLLKKIILTFFIIISFLFCFFQAVHKVICRVSLFGSCR